MNIVHAIVDNVWVPMGLIVLALSWALFWPKKPRKTWRQRVEERTAQLFFQRNHCQHVTYEVPCGPRQDGRRFCNDAWRVYKEARRQAIDEMENTLRYVPSRR